jgi:hypothetical protein
MKVDHKKDKEVLLNLSTALNISKTHIHKDELNYWTIIGKEAWIDTDGESWYLHLSGSVRQWNNWKKALSFMELKIDGDEEGVLCLQRMPDEIESRKIRKLLRLRQSYTPKNFNIQLRQEGDFRFTGEFK